MSARPYSLLALWPIVNRWKGLVLIAVGLAAVVSAGVALMLPNIYKSTTVFYPTNPQSTDPDRIVEGGKLELSGRAEDLDRIITIGNSQPVGEFMVKRFGLVKHYDIDPANPGATELALNEFGSNLALTRTERDAIELTFQDRDKQLAARIANTLVSVIDSFNQQLTLENRRRVLALYRTRYELLQQEYDLARRSLLAGRRRYRIFNTDMQSRYLAKAIVDTETKLRQAEGEGDTQKAVGLRRALHALTHAEDGNPLNLESYLTGVDSVATLGARFGDVQGRMVGARSAYETASLALKGRISSLYLVQKAYPAAKKAKPVRWLIVASSVLLTFVLSVVFIILLELYRRLPRLA